MGRNAQVANIEELHWSGDALDRLAELAGAREMIDVLIDKAVAECRHGEIVRFVDDVGEATRQGEVVRRVSWARIADALDVSRQTAWQKYRYID